MNKITNTITALFQFCICAGFILSAALYVLIMAILVGNLLFNFGGMAIGIFAIGGIIATLAEVAFILAVGMAATVLSIKNSLEPAVISQDIDIRNLGSKF